MLFIDGKCFRFYPWESPVNGESLHWIPQCADAYDKLPSVVGSQPIICFQILDCNKYSQVDLVYWHLKFKENYFYYAIFADFTNSMGKFLKRNNACCIRAATQTASKKNLK